MYTADYDLWQEGNVAINCIISLAEHVMNEIDRNCNFAIFFFVDNCQDFPRC